MLSRMQTIHVPRTGRRYWAALSLASVAGANLGDFCAHDLHAGHRRGLAPLALLLGAVLILERRSRRPGQGWYWLAILILRTAATNLADLADHDLRLPTPAVLAGLAALMAATLLVGRHRRAPGLPATDARYWTAMLLAGTLGTAAGDAIADGLGLGPACALTALALGGALLGGAGYWPSVLAIRTAGTNAGDLLAHALGLPPSAMLSIGAFVGILLVWRSRTGIEGQGSALDRTPSHACEGDPPPGP